MFTIIIGTVIMEHFLIIKRGLAFVDKQDFIITIIVIVSGCYTNSSYLQAPGLDIRPTLKAEEKCIEEKENWFEGRNSAGIMKDTGVGSLADGCVVLVLL